MQHIAPTLIIIFGGTGDLSSRKLLPSLYSLFSIDMLPPTFRIIGFSRRDIGDDGYRNFTKEAVLKKHENTDEETLSPFLQNVSYRPGTFENMEAYHELSQYLKSIDDSLGVCTNKLFYLAVPPSSYEVIFKNLSASGLTAPCGGDAGWTRVLVEKPFGNDLHTAQELDEKLGSSFKEEQIYRIDHYLAKDAVQNLITFRFTNTLFEQIWNREHVEKVHIQLAEDIGVEDRARFYDATGAIRDVGQNHILQMLALIAMENPGRLEASRLQAERGRVLNELHIPNEEEILSHVVQGQYEEYETHSNAEKDSETETYFLVKAFIQNDRWKHVPFYLESGKKLGAKKTAITLTFRSRTPCVCGVSEDHEHKNILTLQIQPTQRISMQFWVKKPGIGFDLETKELVFEYPPSDADLRIPDAYEKILYDCIQGDRTLFVSTEEVGAAWKFITPIIEHRHLLPLHSYAPGSEGPEARHELLDQSYPETEE